MECTTKIRLSLARKLISKSTPNHHSIQLDQCFLVIIIIIVQNCVCHHCHRVSSVWTGLLPFPWWPLNLDIALIIVINDDTPGATPSCMRGRGSAKQPTSASSEFFHCWLVAMSHNLPTIVAVYFFFSPTSHLEFKGVKLQLICYAHAHDASTWHRHDMTCDMTPRFMWQWRENYKTIDEWKWILRMEMVSVASVICIDVIVRS